MAVLANCSRCDDVFAKSMRDICQKCFQEEEKAFEIVYTFLKKRENREATILEIVEATNVEENLINKFLKEKRLRISQFPKLAYTCEHCDTEIVTGRLCNSCSDHILKGFKQQEKESEEKEQEKNANVYYAYGKNKR